MLLVVVDSALWVAYVPSAVTLECVVTTVVVVSESTLALCKGGGVREEGQRDMWAREEMENMGFYVVVQRLMVWFKDVFLN